MYIIVHLQCNHQPHQQVFSLTLCTSQLTIWSLGTKVGYQARFQTTRATKCRSLVVGSIVFSLMIFPSTEKIERNEKMESSKSPFFSWCVLWSFWENWTNTKYPNKNDVSLPRLSLPQTGTTMAVHTGLKRSGPLRLKGGSCGNQVVEVVDEMLTAGPTVEWLENGFKKNNYEEMKHIFHKWETRDQLNPPGLSWFSLQWFCQSS